MQLLHEPKSKTCCARSSVKNAALASCQRGLRQLVSVPRLEGGPRLGGSFSAGEGRGAEVFQLPSERGRGLSLKACPPGGVPLSLSTMELNKVLAVGLPW